MSRRVFALSLLLFLACQPDELQKPRINNPPSAVIAPVTPGVEGSIVSFDGRQSGDIDGDTLFHTWTFGDGKDGRTGARPWHMYTDEGSYTVTLIAKDPAGAADTARAEVIVSNAPPNIIALVTPPEQRLDSAARISVAVHDPGSSDTYSLIVSWGDGKRDTLPGASVATHRYASPGSYLVSVSARDNDGGEGTRTATSPIEVFDPSINRPPVAAITGPSTGREGAIVRFSARGSTDPDGDALRYTWRPGDERDGWPASVIEQGWSYGKDSTYTVSVIVTDGAGAADTASTTVIITNAPPVIAAVSPPGYQAVDVPVSTIVSFGDSGWQDRHTITIQWGDGTSDSAPVDTIQWTDTLVHVYHNVGSYRVTGIVRDDDGGADTGTAVQPVLVIDPSAKRFVAGYEVLDLGTLGGNSARPLDFNDYGQIVGSSLTASGATHAFLWQQGAMRDLGTVGHVGSEAQQINNAGVIAGTVWPAGRHEDCQRSSIATIWRNGTGTLLDSRGATSMPVAAVTINESADVIWSACGHESNYAWLWGAGGWLRLGAIVNPLSASSARSMNEHGQIVGGSGAAYTGESPGPIGHATLWERGAVRDLGVLTFVPCRTSPDRNCGYSTGTGINENGQVVGISTAADRSMHAVLWTNGTIHDIWKAPPFPMTEGGYIDRVIINDVGQVAGSGGGEGFFWSNGALHALGSLGGGKTAVVDMNDAGMVVGTSRTANGEQHAFLWTRDRGMVDLGTGPHGFKAAWVVGISYFGDVVGFTASGCHPAYGPETCWYPSEVRAVLWQLNR